MEHSIDSEWVDSCKNVQRKGRCFHITMRSYRREKNFVYVKDYVYCERAKELLRVKKIQTISLVEFWNLRVVRYRPLAWGKSK
jgi:hypothetical protein